MYPLRPAYFLVGVPPAPARPRTHYSPVIRSVGSSPPPRHRPSLCLAAEGLSGLQKLCGASEDPTSREYRRFVGPKARTHFSPPSLLLRVGCTSACPPRLPASVTVVPSALIKNTVWFQAPSAGHPDPRGTPWNNVGYPVVYPRLQLISSLQEFFGSDAPCICRAFCSALAILWKAVCALVRKCCFFGLPTLDFDPEAFR